MKKLFKALGITIALTTIGVAVRANNGDQKLFPKKAVEKWIQNNTHYTD